MKIDTKESKKIEDCGLEDIKDWFQNYFEKSIFEVVKKDLKNTLVFHGPKAGDLYITTEVTRENGMDVDEILIEGALEGALDCLLDSIQHIGSEKMIEWAEFLEEYAAAMRDTAKQAE